MLRTWGLILAVSLSLSFSATPARAQEFRMYTLVYSEQTEGEDPELVGRSVSLFHAGKVYDFVPEGEREVIIFEPSHHRFMVLSTSRELATTVHFDEITHLLKTAHAEIESRLAELAATGNPDDKEIAAALRFQLAPRFDESYDREKGRLALSSPQLNYRVGCAESKTTDLADVYARYADWVCRLNFLLHPRVLLPGPRLALNEALRREGVVPQEVVLEAEINAPIRLRAEHKTSWALTAADRTLIHGWESMLKSRTTRWVTFQEYQEQVAGGSKRR